MNLPVIGRLDLKSVVIGALLVYFVLPFVLGFVNRGAGRPSKDA